MATRKGTKKSVKKGKKAVKPTVKPPVKPRPPRVKKSAVAEEPVHTHYDEEQIPEDVEEEFDGEPIEIDPIDEDCDSALAGFNH